MWNPFKKKVHYQIPEVKSRWESREKNPFERHRVTVKEVREGYVRYRDDYSRHFTADPTCSLDLFHSSYLELPREKDQ